MVRFKVRIAKDMLALADSATYKAILAQAAQYGMDSVRQAVGTSVGKFSFVVSKDLPLFDGDTMLLTVTWTSRCRMIKPSKPPLQSKDIFGE